MTSPARKHARHHRRRPVGLEAAAVALDHGFDVHVFERGEVAPMRSRGGMCACSRPGA